VRTTLAAGAEAPGEARAFVALHLREAASLPPEVAVDDVLLVTSELVTNAVNAGATTIDVTLDAEPHRVELVVTDDADGWPSPSDPSYEDTTGRGLRIVDHLTHVWNAARHPGGKAVTARWFGPSVRQQGLEPRTR
jgi:two-component sensor histidine kinase